MTSAIAAIRKGAKQRVQRLRNATGSAIPMAAKMMWNASYNAICDRAKRRSLIG
jgi:hypothetical protein